MKPCAKCGYKNEVEAKVCNLCGERLPASSNAADDLSAEPRPLMPKSSSRPLPGKGGAPALPAGIPLGGTRRMAERHCLVPPFGESLPLDVGQVFSIGREEDCSLKLSTVKASRRHAEIFWKETGPSIRDLGSQNGTWVNDKQLPPKTETALKDGDTIQIGDLIVTYKKIAAGISDEDVAEALTATPTTRTPSLKARLAAKAEAENANLEGDASTFSIMDVLTKIAEHSNSGTLTVEVEGAKGELQIVDGKAVSAKYPGLEGPIAIQAIASLKQGRFRFQALPKKEHETGKFATLRTSSGQTPAP